MKRVLGVLGLTLGFGFLLFAVQRWVFSTTYAHGYSTRAFSGIREGDSASRVQQVLGEPLRKYVFYVQPGTSNIFTIWEYSAATRAPFYQVRFLIFYNEVVRSKADTFSLR